MCPREEPGAPLPRERRWSATVSPMRYRAASRPVTPGIAKSPLLDDRLRAVAGSRIGGKVRGSDGRWRSARGTGFHGRAPEWRRLAMIRCFCDRASFRTRALGVLLAAAGLSLIGTAAKPTAARADEPAALKIGLLMDLSSGSAEVWRDRQRAFELAIRHVNAAAACSACPWPPRSATPRRTRRKRSRQHGVSSRSRASMPLSAPTPAPMRCRSPSGRSARPASPPSASRPRRRS